MFQDTSLRGIGQVGFGTEASEFRPLREENLRTVLKQHLRVWLIFNQVSDEDKKLYLKLARRYGSVEMYAQVIRTAIWIFRARTSHVRL